MISRHLLGGLSAGVVLAGLFLALNGGRPPDVLAAGALREALGLAEVAQDEVAQDATFGSTAEIAGLEGAPSAAAQDAGPGTAVALEPGGAVSGSAKNAADNPGLVELLPEPETEEEPRADRLRADAFLGALSKQTVIRSKPDPKAPIIGFARTGTLLRRALVPAGHRGCKNGWYLVEPRGYVCVGQAATLDPEHPIVQLSSMQPDRSLPMPYVYGRSRYPTPPLYTRIPTEDEQQIAEQDLRGHLRKNLGKAWSQEAKAPPPSLLSSGETIPRPFGYPILEHSFMTGRALGNSAFSFIDLFESGGRQWGLTADLNLVPLDRVTPIEASEFFGLVLEGELTLPVAFVRKNGEQRYAGDPEAGSLKPVGPIEYRTGFSLTGREVKIAGVRFLETRSGEYIKDHDRLVKINPREKMPKWASKDRTWIDISILTQTLVAYRGDVPQFATLVSSGKDGLGDPKETHSTAQGVFLIHTKHVTATMSGQSADDEFDLRDVPYVQYFHEGFALHASYWHDSYGSPRSHGCVNLSPPDARHLFNWTEPSVPARWHSALSREGTLVYVHP